MLAGRAGALMTTSPERIGLCFDCVHSRQVPSRTAIYWRCALAETDPRFDRYPRLPVTSCAGYTPREAGAQAPKHDDPG